MDTASSKRSIAPLVPGDNKVGSAKFWNQVIDTCNAIRSLRVERGGGVDEFILSDYNAVLRLADGTDGSSPVPATAVKCYILKSVQNDYLTCREFTGTEGTVDIYIAKPHKLRNSIASEIIEGVTYSYTYAAGPDSLNKYRIASVSGVEVERCVVTPEWLANDTIYGIDCTTYVATATDVLMLGDGRAWAVYA